MIKSFELSFVVCLELGYGNKVGKITLGGGNIIKCILSSVKAESGGRFRFLDLNFALHFE